MDKLLKQINIVRVNNDLEEIKSINLEDNLMKDLGFNSLDLAELTVRCEAEFDIDIFEDGIVTTIGEILEKLNE